MPADDLTDPAPATAVHATWTPSSCLERSIAEKGIYPAIDPLAAPSAASSTRSTSAQEHYDVARQVQQILQRYRDLQDIIAILGVDELSEEDKLIVARARQIERFLSPAVLRGRGVHRQAGQLHAAGRDDPLASRRSATASGTTCPSRRSCTSAPIEEAAEQAEKMAQAAEASTTKA